MHSAESSVRDDFAGATEAGLKARPEEKAHDRKIFLLVLLMLLLISQVAVLLFNSSLIVGSSDPLVADKKTVSAQDIKKVESDLREVMSDLNALTKEPEVKVKPVEVEKVKVMPVVTPVAIPVVTPVAPVVSKVAKVKEKPPVVPVIVEPANKALLPTVEKAVEVTAIVDKRQSYIKYDAKGDFLDDNTPQWTCVYDMYNGLMWETKSETDTMRDSKNLYSWFDPQSKGFQGVADGGRCKGDSDCDTASYVQAMNERNYCGHNDWELPTRKQLLTLVNLKNKKSVATINKHYFPDTMPSWYWTSSENNNNKNVAWYVLFRNGFALSDMKERPKHIRLVRIAKTNISSN